MQALGIKDLQTNPAQLTRSLAAHEYTMITKRNKPIGIAVPFDDRVISDGLRSSLMIRSYEEGLISLGQLASALEMSKRDAMKMLSLQGINVIDYDFDEDLALAERI
jgi:predicted HTH domain antitoxin